MKIVHIVPGSGTSFYCQNCLRDIALVRALRALGHEVLIVPMYLPLLTDYPDVKEDADIFYGAVGLYVKEKLPLFKKAPLWMQKLLDSPRLLSWAAGKAGSTSSRDLAEMTVSMLKGEEGRQAAELDRLVAWLESEEKPDVVHLSNALLLGLARRMKSDLGAPIVCSLQDEDSWVDTMGEESAGNVWNTMADRAGDVDAFVAVSRYYANAVAPRMNLKPEQIHVVPIGIELNGFEPRPLPFDPPAIGYLSRMCESLGAGLLTDAFIKLKEDGRFKDLKLRFTGGRTDADIPFIKQMQERLTRLGLQEDVELVRNFDRPGRIRFLQSISIMSVPVIRGEALGMHLLEALASGVPIVQPKVGGFPELVDATGGGILYEPNNADALAEALGKLLLDPERARRLGASGRDAVSERFSVKKTASEMMEIYGRLVPLKRVAVPAVPR